MLLFGLSIVVQAVRVQTVRPEHWIAQSDSVYVKYRSIDAQRGNIISSDGRLLATTLPTFDIRMDLKADGLTDEIFRNNIVALSQNLAKEFPYRNAKSWERKLTQARGNGERYHLIQRRVNYRTMLEMRTWPIWDRGQYKGGLIVLENSTRKTPFGQLASRTIGYSKKVGEGKFEGVGLEASFQNELKGTEGRRLEQRIAGGTWVPVNGEYQTKPQNGKDIVTTIDVNVQDVAESTLEQVLIDNSAEWGCALVMEVETGKLKAIANLTRNDNGTYTENYNYAIGYAGEPGSTMKLVTLAALLEDGYVTIQDSVDIHNGRLKLPGRLITDSGGWSPYRNVTVQTAFEKSSNVAFTSLAYKYYNSQPKKFLSHLESFHFNDVYGVEVAGERKPFYRQPGDNGWSAMSIPSLSFGYEISMTPLQMLAFYSAIANNGKLMKPYMVEQVLQNGEVKKQFEPTVLNKQVVSESTVSQLKQCLEGVVENGTARSLASTNYRAAGKTGTTKLFVPGESYGHYYTASFAGYFPAEQPKYSMIVVVNKPRGGQYYGGAVAGPVFKSVADMLYARSLELQQPVKKMDSLKLTAQLSGVNQKVKAVESAVFNKAIEGSEYWLSVENNDTTVTVGNQIVAVNTVPNVQHMGIDDALFLLENAGLQVRVLGSGVVKSQSIQPGQKFNKGQQITIQLGV